MLRSSRLLLDIFLKQGQDLVCIANAETALSVVGFEVQVSRSDSSLGIVPIQYRPAITGDHS